jgi:hypothetical protein
MISHIPQSASDWLVELSLITVMGLPPKDPDDDDDENCPPFEHAVVAPGECSEQKRK